MPKFLFKEDFANNWRKGQTVECSKQDNSYLVDGVALIEVDELIKHGNFIERKINVLGIFNGDVFVFDRDFKSGDIVQHFKGGLYKIIDIVKSAETDERIVVYESLNDSQKWARTYLNFSSKTDTKKYPNANQPFRFIRVEIVD